MKVLLAIWIVLTSSLTSAQVEDFASVSFKKADSIAGLFPKHSLTNLQSLANQLTQPLTTDVEKFRAIYTWVCLNIENDYGLFLRYKQHSLKKHSTAQQQQWNAKFSKDVFRTLRDKHRTLCTGYAYLIRELATRAGFSCEIINGYGRTAHANIGGSGIVNHSWNAIQLNSNWYLCDATWSSGIVDGEKHVFRQEYNDIYFLLDPTLFALNHYPVEETWFLLDDKPILNDFLNQPIIYNALLRHKIQSVSPSAFRLDARKGEPVQFEFNQNAHSNINRAEIRVLGHEGSTSYFPPIKPSCDDNSWTISHTFSSRGARTLHILLDNQFVCSYQVSVLDAKR